MKTATFRIDVTQSELYTLRRILGHAQQTQGIWNPKRVRTDDLAELVDKVGWHANDTQPVNGRS